MNCGAQHHFVGKCDFHLATFVGSLLVSTVGEYRRQDAGEKKFTALAGAADSFFETMVFRTDGVDGEFGHPTVTEWSGMGDVSYYATAIEANAGHVAVVGRAERGDFDGRSA